MMIKVVNDLDVKIIIKYPMLIDNEDICNIGHNQYDIYIYIYHASLVISFGWLFT